jgi:plastocyanin
LRRVLPAVLCLSLGAACGDGPNEAFTVALSPAAATLFSAAPGNTIELDATARSEDGQVLAGGTTSFTSANTSIATVTAAGVVTGVAAGTTQITGSVTLDGATVSGTTAVTVEDADPSATVRAPAFTFTPGTVDVQAGGSVTWTIDAIHHAVEFTTSGAPADVPELINASATRTFSTSGTFSYRCPIHPQMAGVVRVH